MDIRDVNNSTIQFADRDGGNHRCYSLAKSIPVQFHIESVDGSTLHIKHKDIDNLIKALKYAKMHWGE